LIKFENENNKFVAVAQINDTNRDRDFVCKMENPRKSFFVAKKDISLVLTILWHIDCKIADFCYFNGKESDTYIVN